MRHEQRCARQLPQVLCSLCYRLVYKTPVRIDSNELVQRPGGGNALAGLAYIGLQAGIQLRESQFFSDGVHLVTPDGLLIDMLDSLAGQTRNVMRVNHSSRYNPA